MLQMLYNFDGKPQAYLHEPREVPNVGETR